MVKMFDVNSAITENDIVPLAQDATEGVFKTGSYIMKKASEDNVVGQNKELFKSFSKNLSIGGKILSNVFSAYNIYKEVNSLPTKSESISKLTFSLLQSIDFGKINITNPGIFKFAESYNGQIDTTKEIVTKSFKAIENYFSAFDFNDEEQLQTMEAFIAKNAYIIMNDALKFR